MDLGCCWIGIPRMWPDLMHCAVPLAAPRCFVARGAIQACLVYPVPRLFWHRKLTRLSVSDAFECSRSLLPVSAMPLQVHDDSVHSPCSGQAKLRCLHMRLHLGLRCAMVMITSQPSVSQCLHGINQQMRSIIRGQDSPEQNAIQMIECECRFGNSCDLPQNGTYCPSNHVQELSSS
jgi:hypothetical protein